MSKITLVLPLVTENEKCVGQFKKMLESLATINGLKDNVSELIVASGSFNEELKKAFDESPLKTSLDFTEIKTDENTYASLVNTSIMSVSTEYFTVVSVNDTYATHWIDDFLIYEAEEKDNAAYLSLGINRIDDERMYFINEIAWSSGFANIHGHIDMDALLTLTPFKTAGAFFNTEEFITLGKLKDNLTVSVWFDYLLRIAEADKGIFVIPRVTYIVDGLISDSFTGVGNSDINNYNSGEFAEVAKPYEKNDEETDKQPTFKVVETK